MSAFGSNDPDKSIAIPAALKQGASADVINVNGIEISWDTDAGTCNFRNIPVAMMWVDSTLAGLMSGVESMVGPERFNLALQAEGRKSVESDWLLLSSYSDFAEGFAQLNLNAKVAGWGDWQLVNYDRNKRECVFRAFNNWEGGYQRALGVCWGSGMLAGKLAGICSKLFQANCWATQTRFTAKGDPYDEFLVAPSDRSLEREIDALLDTDNATRADMAVALRKLQNTEKILRESQERYDRLVRNIPDGVFTWIFRADGTMGFEYVSPKFCELLDLEAEAVLRDYRPAFAAHPEDVQSLLDANVKSRLDMQPFRWEGRFIIRGELRWMRISSDPTPLADGGSLWSGVVSDITAQKLAEIQLRKNEEELSSIFDTLSEGVALNEVVFDANGEMIDYRLLKVNKAFFQVADYIKGGAVIGQTATELYGMSVETIRDFWRQHKLHHQAVSTEFVSPVSKKYFRITTSPFVGNRFVTTFRDITESKNKERLLMQWSDAFNHAVLGIALGDAVTQRVMAVNPAFAAMLGRSVEELVDSPIIEIYAPSERARIKDVIAEVTRNGLGRYESRMIRKDGSEFAVQVDLAVAQDEKGLPVYRVATVQDITERKRVENELLESRVGLASAQRLAQIGSWEWSVQENTARWSDETYRIFGLEPGALDEHRQSFLSMIHPDDRERTDRALSDALSGTKEYDIDYRIVLADGAEKNIHALAEVLRDAEGKPYLMRGSVQDITERKAAEEKLHLTARVFENTLEGILIADADRNIVEVNEAFTRITGYARDEVLGQNPRLLKSGHHGGEFYSLMWDSIRTQGYWVGEIWNRRKNGEVYPEALSVSSVKDENNKVINYVGIFSDITLLKQHEKQLERTAHYDALTGIPNRVLLADRLGQALAHARRNGTMLAVCYLDLDGFKPINDAYGHEAGDKILIEIARRIEASIRGDDTVARLGGDEFVILQLGLERADEYILGLDRLLESIGSPIIVAENTFRLGASIGVALYPLDDVDGDVLLRHADQAMYTAKQSGKNRYHLYDPERDQRARANQTLLGEIAKGLFNGEFVLYYQPKVEMRTRKLAGVEALIRWHHPLRGLLGPDSFLPVLDGTELEIRLGEWVIDTAIGQMLQWQRAGLSLEVSINISARHLQSPDFAARLRKRLADCPELSPGRLQIEILETAALEDVTKVNAIIEECRAIGVSFALDDFGTGYSSLSYLSNLPVDTLKIDQSFVRDMMLDAGDHAIVQGVIALADAFGRDVVAEGVENDETYQALLKLGCQLGQGYGIARPMPADQLMAWRYD